jgi:hypothetical protein
VMCYVLCSAVLCCADCNAMRYGVGRKVREDRAHPHTNTRQTRTENEDRAEHSRQHSTDTGTDTHTHTLLLAACCTAPHCIALPWPGLAWPAAIHHRKATSSHGGP